MQSFNQKTKIDLPDIKKKQIYKRKETDDFNVLFDNDEKKETDLIDLRKNRKFNNNQEYKVLKDYYLYFVVGFILLIAVCSLTVQIVINSPESEKYKTIANNIEDVDSDFEGKEVIKKNNDSASNNIPEVQFANDIVKPQKQITVKKTEIAEKLKQKIVVKPLYVIVQKPHLITAAKSQNITLKKAETKAQEAIAETMLRPLAVILEPGLRALR